MTLTPTRTDLRSVYKNCGRNARPVQQMDLEGNVLHTYKSIYDAKTSTALGYAGIRDCVKGIRKEFAGFTWRFVTNPQ